MSEASGDERSQRARWVLAAPLARLARRPLESLPARIVVATFVATIAICLGVTWISARSTESFLRAKLEQKYPTLLRSVSERLALGYSQRQLEMETFARSATLVEGLRRRGSAGGASEEARVYLGYVLQRFPQFEALFALDLEGAVLAWAGEETLLTERLRQRLAAAQEPGIGDILRLGGRRIQLASCPIRAPDGERLATLHALVALPVMEASLPMEELSSSGAIYVLGRDGRTLLASAGAPARAREQGPRPQPGSGPELTEYTGEGGESIVGGALAFPRFGWTLVVEEPYAAAFAPVVALIRHTLRINLVIVGAFGLFAFQVARSIVRPVVELSARATRIAAGETGVELPVSPRGDEIGILTHAIREMTERLHANQLELEDKRREIERANLELATHNVQLQQMNETLEQLSITDGLTRLHNHRFFQDHLPQELKRAARTGDPVALLMIDIDDFKRFNDRYGHAAGDDVLRRTAEVMNGVVREMDLLCRYGGEEFALLAGGADLAGALKLGEKIRAAIESARFEVEDAGVRHGVQLTVSIGVASFKGDPRAFFNDADRALYRAKREGKNRVVASG